MREPVRVEAQHASGQNLYRETLRMLVLRVLAEKPMHGYQIIKRIEEVTGGKWRPAAGTLYPVLDQLKAEGLVDVERVVTEGVRGGRKVVYRLTEKGWRELAGILEAKAKAKIDFYIYFVVEGCSQLEKGGYRDLAERICGEVRENVARLASVVEEACSRYTGET